MHMNRPRVRRVTLVGAALALLVAGFDLDALIAAARTEPGITVYDQTTKVVATAEAFAAEYGLEATGVKVELGAIDKVLKGYHLALCDGMNRGRCSHSRRRSRMRRRRTVPMPLSSTSTTC